MHIVDFSPGMGQTHGFRYSDGFEQRPVTTVSIGLKHFAVTGLEILWMDTFPVCTRTRPPGHLRIGITVITDVDPQPGGSGFTAARLLDRNGDMGFYAGTAEISVIPVLNWLTMYLGQ